MRGDRTEGFHRTETEVQCWKFPVYRYPLRTLHVFPSSVTASPCHLPPRGQCPQLKHQGTVYLCHCEERSDVAIRFLLGNMFEIGTLQGERIATPVCGLVRNDREIGPWFLKLMTLPPGEGIAFRHPYKHQFIGQLSKVNKHKFLYGKFLRRGVSSWVGPTIKASWGKAVKGEKEACGKPPFISVVFPGSRGSGR